jgi:hypothetical protein
MTDSSIDPTQPSPAPTPRPSRTDAASPYTRWAATLILVPGVPLLLASIAALALFYAAPARFSNLLARLPGQDLLRTILFFAPATLFAIVVLAALYALERPSQAPAAIAPARRPPVSLGILAIAVPLLLVAATAWVARFLAPGRFGSLLDPLPGTVYLQRVVTLAPPALFILTLAALAHALLTRPRAAPAPEPPHDGEPASRLARAGATLILLPSIPLLAVSLATLALYAFSPVRLDALLTRLSQPTVVRLALILAPAMSLAIVLLAGLYLFHAPRRPMANAAPTPPPAGRPPSEARQIIATGILTAGLALTALIGLGLIGALVWLLLR